MIGLVILSKEYCWAGRAYCTRSLPVPCGIRIAYKSPFQGVENSRVVAGLALVFRRAVCRLGVD